MAASPGKARNKKAEKTERATRAEPPLSVERIVATAVDLLDSNGLDGLTMRRLANRIGAGAMSLYWHVANKEEVLDLALDSVLAYRQPAPGDAPDAWREDVIHVLEDWRTAMLRHPWSAALLPQRALGPNMLGRLERLSKALSGAGIADADLNVAIWSLWNYVMGATVTRASFNRSEDDLVAAQAHLTRLNAQYPTIERSRLLLDADWGSTFRKGLEVLLDGLMASAKKTR